MAVRRGLVPPEEDPSSHISAFTELYLDAKQRFLRSSSVSFSPRRGNMEDGMCMQGSMTNSPWMACCSLESARKLVGLDLKVTE
jgi:hypothetical protein